MLSADDVDILVHGTSFRVSSYVNDSEVEVALLSGAIDMQTKNLQQNCKIQMTPGDMVKVDKRSGRVTSMRFPRRDVRQRHRRRSSDVHQFAALGYSPAARTHV